MPASQFRPFVAIHPGVFQFQVRTGSLPQPANPRSGIICLVIAGWKSRKSTSSRLVLAPTMTPELVPRCCALAREAAAVRQTASPITRAGAYYSTRPSDKKSPVATRITGQD